MNHPVITSEQARKITGGRTPHVPIQYEQACKALAECVDLDDAKVWADKADALAAWAKIYRDGTIGRQAKVLKLKAYRRMGELANELRPRKYVASSSKTRPGKTILQRKGPFSLLKETGLKPSEALAARALSRADSATFDRLIDRPMPPSVHHARTSLLKNCSEVWKQLGSANGMTGFRAFCRRYPAKDTAQALWSGEVPTAKKMLLEITEWLDEFEQHLPKEKP